ncbi:MAG: monooxygenase [Polyangiaceae bacterium UTPRO1]|jgi:cation diffusion facilitator CzcD-associated flavoprotein CzcO|nr:NAD(P)/FAD-dependent oxidoreductase [Myxococcales bacterium]OQY64908.1 MAG: monooxygenase [Polyangiaceae bacterium UTPRO1]
MTTSASPSAGSERPCRFIIIGAGMSGILAAIELRKAGFHDFTIYERADRLGGTWRDNTYPGLACDVPSHLYCYSFAPNPDWSHRFASGAEIQSYFEAVARRFGIDRLIRYGKEVRRCTFADGRWKIELADGSGDAGDFVIAATGVLRDPAYPDIPGLETFAGPTLHTARWDHGVATAGRRIGVIGTGSSAIQVVSALVHEVSELALFQRTPQWIMAQDNPAYTPVEQAEFRTQPEKMAALRADISRAFADGFSNAVIDADSPQLQAIHDACVANLETSVRDPELRERLRPSYRAGCKRLIMSADFYEAIQRPNARLVTAAITGIEPAGVRTQDGRLHPLDVLVLATGYQVDRFVRPIEVVGRNGVALDEVWKDGPFAYLAISVPAFPNFFMLNGPNGPVGNFSLIEVAELQIGYILQLVEHVRRGAYREVSAAPAAMERFAADRREAARTTIWQSGCRSWYLDPGGVPIAWPWTFDRFREEMRAPQLADYERR